MTNTQEKIQLFRKGSYWMMKSDSPSLFDLTGTDTIPTNFKSDVPSKDVLDFFLTRHPNACITIEGD